MTASPPAAAAAERMLQSCCWKNHDDGMMEQTPKKEAIRQFHLVTQTNQSHFPYGGECVRFFKGGPETWVGVGDGHR